MKYELMSLLTSFGVLAVLLWIVSSMGSWASL